MTVTARQELARRTAEARPAEARSEARALATQQTELHRARVPHTPSRQVPWRSLMVIPCLWLLAAVALAIDLPVAHFWKSVKTPGFVVDMLESAETFGNGAGVVLLIVVVYRLGVIGIRSIPRVALASLGSGLVADLFKLIVARTRPRELSTQQSIFETFGTWWPSFKAETGVQSFPSAHVATAVGLAFALSYIYPRGRWVFGSLAVIVALQRLQTGAHFVSDTLAGAAIAWGAVMVLYHAPLISTALNRLERSPSCDATHPTPHHAR